MKKRLLAIVLAMTVVFAYSAVGTFAADGEKTGGDKAKLVKYLKVAEGVENAPVNGFKFDFKKVAVTAKDKEGNELAAAVKGDLKDSKDFSYTMPALEKTGTDYKQSATINTVFGDNVPSKPGVYQYAVTEDNKTFTNTETEKMTFDASTYQLVITVNSEGEIDQVAVINPNGKKANPTEEPTDEDGDGVVETKGFSFVNNFEKTVKNHEEPTNPDNPDGPQENKKGAFDLKKLVAGQYADKDKEFDFTITVELPKNNTEEYDVPTSAKLSHNGESFNVAVLPIGTKITVAEAAADGYTASWISSNENKTTVMVGEKGAYVKCTNKFDDNSVTPTGIIINNLPYVLLVVLAVAGIAVFARKRRYE